MTGESCWKPPMSLQQYMMTAVSIPNLFMLQTPPPHMSLSLYPTPPSTSTCYVLSHGTSFPFLSLTVFLCLSPFFPPLTHPVASGCCVYTLKCPFLFLCFQIRVTIDCGAPPRTSVCIPTANRNPEVIAYGP